MLMTMAKKWKIKMIWKIRMILNLERCCIRGGSTISCDSTKLDLSQALGDLLLLVLKLTLELLALGTTGSNTSTNITANVIAK